MVKLFGHQLFFSLSYKNLFSGLSTSSSLFEYFKIDFRQRQGRGFEGKIMDKHRHKQSDHTIDEQLKHFDKILKEHGEEHNDLTALPVTTIDHSRDAECHTSSKQHLMLDKINDKKLNLVLVATSLDEKDVVTQLKNTIGSSMIPLKFGKCNSICQLAMNQTAHSGRRSQASIGSQEMNTEDVTFRTSERGKRTRKISEPNENAKDGKYWKRRSSNNESAKRSRDARKARLEWIEKRTKELEIENVALRQQLDSLTLEVSKMENSSQSSK